MSDAGLSLDVLRDYWTTNTDSYAAINEDELNSYKKQAWLDLLNANIPQGKSLRVLDIGCGAGFLAIILAEQGHVCTATDFNKDMLELAKQNAGALQSKITFRQMDAQELDFPDNSFDVIVSRNVTWDLERPDEAYREWLRVLDVGGRFLNFDCNWYLHLSMPEWKEKFDQDRANMKARGFKDDWDRQQGDPYLETVIPHLPLTHKVRPLWDVATLMSLGCKRITVQLEVSKGIWDEVESVSYASTPMFMVIAEKCE